MHRESRLIALEIGPSNNIVDTITDLAARMTQMATNRSRFFTLMIVGVMIALPSMAFSTIWRIQFECGYWPPVLGMDRSINVSVTTKNLPDSDLPESIDQDDISTYEITDGIYNKRTSRDCELMVDHTDCNFEIELDPTSDSGQHAYIMAEFKEDPGDYYSHYTIIVDTSFNIKSYVHSAFLNERGMSYTIGNDYAICSGLTVTQLPPPSAPGSDPPVEKRSSAETVQGYADMAIR